mmetsp:Transcript_38485/g.49694  ORF Transcript_38485/g.49694 Transcript_38485/m.49694 type:complete len:478 (-) Transcript_38485:615-2048(-)
MFGAITEDNELEDDLAVELGPRREGVPSQKSREQSASSNASGVVSMPSIEPTLSLLELSLKGGNQIDPGLLKHLPELQVTDPMIESLKTVLPSKKSLDSKVKVEWVVEIADQDLNWFVGTAYMYDDDHRTVHVCVPDNEAPTWEGDMPLDFRACHLLECCNESSLALFNVAITSGLMPVNWVVAWEEEGAGTQQGRGRWFLPLAYQLVIEDGTSETKFMSLPLGNHVTLLACECDGLGEKAFFELVEEGCVAYHGPPPSSNRTPENHPQQQQRPEESQPSGPQPSASQQQPQEYDTLSRPAQQTIPETQLGMRAAEIGDLDHFVAGLLRTVNTDRLRVLYNLEKDVRKFTFQAVDERERLLREHNYMIDGLYRYIYDGDLLEGCALLDRLQGPPNKNMFVENQEAVNAVRTAIVILDDALQRTAVVEPTPESFHSQPELQEEYVFEDLKRKLRAADEEFHFLRRKLEDLQQEYSERR